MNEKYCAYCTGKLGRVYTANDHRAFCDDTCKTLFEKIGSAPRAIAVAEAPPPPQGELNFADRHYG